MKIKNVLLILLLFIKTVSLAQESKIDSALTKLISLTGTKKIDALNSISQMILHEDAVKASSYANNALSASKTIGYANGMMEAYGNLAKVEVQLSHFENSLKYSLEALKIAEKNNNDYNIGQAYVCMANAYLNMNNHSFAVINYKRSIVYFERINDSLNLATIYNNLAVSYDNRNILDTALFYYNKAFPIYKSINNKRYLGLWYMNVGDLYRKQEKIDKALEYQLIAEPILIDANDQFTLMVLYSGLPYTYIELNKTEKALEYAQKAIDLGVKLKSARELSYAYLAKADVYNAQKEFEKEALLLRQYIVLNDSIFSEETSRTIAEMQSKYNDEKKQKQIEILNKDKALQTLEIDKHKSQQIIYIGIVSFVVLLSFLLVIGIRSKNKANRILHLQNNEIEHQKHLIEEKQKEIIDSINYAKRLQQAILATPDEINKYLPNNFLLYKPKDIVAGDFYFFETTNTHVFYAAADCTGHGVPGAMVSVVCANALNRCVKEFGLTEPGKILDKTRELVLETFTKSSSEVKDGMDISLISIAKNTNEVMWSGANNPLWYICTTTNSDNFQNESQTELVEVKADKQPIGKTDNPTPFTTHIISNAKGCTFYLLTDGYPDQFGGDKGKKFKYKQLEQLLLNNHNLSFNEQENILRDTFEKWKGSLEQVDDVCIIGFKL